MTFRFCLLYFCAFAWVMASAQPLAAAERLYDVGIGRIDITPDYPIRLTGYLIRKTESEGVAQHLWAKALAIAATPAEPFVLIAVDNCGIPAAMREEVLRRLSNRGVVSERFAIAFSHTHSGPCVTEYSKTSSPRTFRPTRKPQSTVIPGS